MSRIFPGWWVVAGTFVVLCVGFGIAYSFSSFFLPLQETYAARRGEIALVFSIAGALYFSLGLVTGAVADRFGPRLVVGGGMALVALGTFAASQAQSLWQVFAGYGLGVGLGLGAAYVPSVAALQRWFNRKRGLATGIAVAGIGVGTLTGPPLAQLLIEHVGWRGAWAGLALVALAAALFAALSVRRSPETYGLRPDGDVAPVNAGPAPPASGDTLGEAARRPVFWLLFAACAIYSFGLFTPFVHLVPYARDVGHGEAFGVTLIMLLGVGSTLGRFVFAGFADRIGRRRMYALSILGSCPVLMLWAASSHWLALVAFATLFGALYGGFVAMAPSVMADYFGTRSVGSILGAQYASVAVGILVGPPAAGWIYDTTQSYTAAIVASAGLALAAGLTVLFCPEPSVLRARQTATEPLR
ncbi:MAG: MFS transporter [Reyranellaceae bacterium]